jgi:hypothetical protein
MRLLFSILTCVFTYSGVFAQKVQRLESNRTFSVYNAFGNAYQSIGCSVPLAQSSWELHAQRNLGIIEMEKFDCPSNYFVGGLKKVQVNPKWSVKLGAGIISKLEFSNLNFSISPVAQAKYQVLPWLSLGSTYIKFVNHCESQVGSNNRLIQLSTHFDLNWHSKSNGLITVRSKNPIYIDAFASSGINYTAAGIELSKSKQSHFALRGQLFTKYGGLFNQYSRRPDIQWLGVAYNYILAEITVKAGGGLTTNVFSNNLRSSFEPYFFASIQQKLMNQTHLFVEVWQPTLNYFSASRAPFFQVGLSIELI